MFHVLPFIKVVLISTCALIVCFFLFLFIGWPQVYPKTRQGITWSVTYARYLGIDPLQGLRAAIEELGVRHVRLPAYWSEIEPVDGQFDWRLLDAQFSLLQEKEGSVILVVGAKQPRWPECWYPDWVKTLSKDERDQRQLAYVEAVVTRYKNHPILYKWQVENEPQFFGTFGDCALFDKAIVKQEAALVARLDRSTSDLPDHPLVTTASGELSRWDLPAPHYTGLGVSVYRVVANTWHERWSYWFIPPWVYHRKALLFPVGWAKQLYVSEFQMEPWVTEDILTLPVEKQFRTFDLAQMKKNIWYAQHIDVPEVYYWGTEWWYWMKEKHQHPEFWEEAKLLFH